MANKSTLWWGTYHIEENQSRYWEVGPLLLGIQRLPLEWQVAHQNSEDPDQNNIRVAITEKPPSKRELLFKRFVFSKTFSDITLTPILADRTQVSCADKPFYLPANEKVTIYISSPAWIRIEVDHRKVTLGEIPTVRQSDTWYGPNTREGELCYFSQMVCRTHLEDLPIRSHRIISPVIIENQTHDSLLLERLSLPLPYLSVYTDLKGHLWTEDILVRHEQNQKLAIKQGKGAPHIAPSAQLISSPRLTAKSHKILNLFHTLLAE